mmetsp:Transcript_7645/g.8849  ORF Transcript_7645/g.8849 Transcript_7645/m.8849 type:complete len:119 (-) Transcript_7645:146-502(-)
MKMIIMKTIVALQQEREEVDDNNNNPNKIDSLIHLEPLTYIWSVKSYIYICIYIRVLPFFWQNNLIRKVIRCSIYHMQYKLSTCMMDDGLCLFSSLYMDEENMRQERIIHAILRADRK